jgi:hypothetical protein
MEAPDPATGRSTISGKLGATGLRVLLPVTKVPTNIVSEILDHISFGVPGLAKLARAHWRGIEKLQPAEADIIMRQLRQGLIGGALLAVGYFLRDEIGGFYQEHDRRKPGDVGPMQMRVLGVTIPTWALHSPLMMTLQLGATIGRVADSHVKVHGVQERKGIVNGAVNAMLGLAEEVPYVRETVEISRMRENPDRAIGRQVSSMVIPQAVNQTAKFFDKDYQGNPIKRKTEGVMENIQSNIPGLRSRLPVRK